MTTQEIQTLSYQHPIIAFDGVCNLCNGFVLWLIRRDHGKVFRFVALQSDTGNEMMKKEGHDLDTVILVYKGISYTHSDVALKCMSILGGLWPVLSILFIVPKMVRDGIYNFIARNRYKWFGKKEACMIPDESIKELFI